MAAKPCPACLRRGAWLRAQRPDTSTYKSLPGPRRPAVGSHTDDRRDDLARPPPEYWGAPPDYSTPTASLQRTRPRPSSGPGPGAGPGSPPAAAPARRPVVAEVVVLGAKDMDVPNAGADFARDLFARARLGGAQGLVLSPLVGPSVHAHNSQTHSPAWLAFFPLAQTPGSIFHQTLPASIRTLALSGLLRQLCGMSLSTSVCLTRFTQKSASC